MARKPPRSRVRAHRFFADSDLPAAHDGKRRCRRCGLMGKPGDAHHPTDEDFDATDLRPTSADAKAIDDRILGEGGDAA